ncbi:MAG: ribosome silencing factor [Deltaproteobacteria bacterium]|jgi:ribosome-associated protein|nr:ribosome silencing factor [Deltaproteobacteria bacterium]
MVCRAAGTHDLESPVLLNLTGMCQVTDFFYVASAESSKKVKSVAEDIVRRLREQGVRPLNVDGLSNKDASWVVLDFGDVMAHIFQPEARLRYDMEGLWADAQREDPATLARPPKSRKRPA